jgi:hypothetical protein
MSLASPRRRADLPKDRLAERIGAAAYGSVLVLAALGAVDVADVAEGHSVALVAGVGVATWIAHLFAEILADHVRHDEPLARPEIRRAAIDGLPILSVTVLPAISLFAGRIDVVDEETARTLAILVALAQLGLVGAIVAHVTDVEARNAWSFAAFVMAVGIAVVVLKVALGH